MLSFFSSLFSGLVIVLSCIAAAVGYGIVHDQITVRVCLEYFTIGHPVLIDAASPTLVALLWGVIATWWVGLLLGIPLAMAAQIGRGPRLTIRDLWPSVARLLGVMGLGALIAGLVGAILASLRWVYLVEPLASRVPPPAHVGFLADGFSHWASYAIGILGGLVVVSRTWLTRRSMSLKLGASQDDA